MSDIFSFEIGTDYVKPISTKPARDISDQTFEFRATGQSNGVTLVKNSGVSGSGLTVVDATTGTMQLAFFRADTETTLPDAYFWSLRQVDAGENTVEVSGIFYVTAAPIGS